MTRGRTPSRSRGRTPSLQRVHAVPEAQQVLTNPFPVPKLHRVTVDLQSGRGVGIVMSDRFVPGTNSTNSFPRHVEITKLSRGNIFQGTAVQLGQQVLAVQGEAIATAFQSASRMKKAIKIYNENRRRISMTQANLLTVLTCDPVLSPFCKLFAINLDESSPGINFDSACSRSLVKVSYLYRKRASPFRGRIKPGDIILAINNIPVSTPEAAYQLLYESRQQGSSLTTIYAVDMSELCQSIAKQVQTDHLNNHSQRSGVSEHRVWRDLRMVKTNPSNEFTKHDSNEDATTKDMLSLVHDADQRSTNKVLVTSLVFDKENLLLLDAHVPSSLMTAKNSTARNALGLDARYFSVVVPFVQKFNGLLQETLDELIESVGCAIWQQAVPRSTLVPPMTRSPSSSMPLPSAPMEIDNDEDIPTVEASIIVSDVSL